MQALAICETTAKFETCVSPEIGRKNRLYEVLDTTGTRRNVSSFLSPERRRSRYYHFEAGHGGTEAVHGMKPRISVKEY